MLSNDSLQGLQEVMVRLLAATVIGGAVGLNRELHEKPAGLRTHILVSIGAATAVLISEELHAAGAGASVDVVSRVVQGILTGIGFVGAGVILRTDSDRRVHGLTTAASIWIVACLGIACGVGQWMTALAASVLTLIVLVVGYRVEAAMHRYWHMHDRGGPPGA